MGVVYKAHDTKLNRTVALKFLPPHLSASEKDKARFVQEAQSASALNHPNVCTIHDIQEYDGQMFIVMEFVDGQTLREKRGTISFKQAIEFGIQIADGLAAAHEKGIVHRDIKPDNIMIRKDGIVQIMDFGLAKLRESGSKITRLTKEGSTLGTAGFMSPEQVQGQETDHRSDIFSFGVLLYELFTGQLPFKGVHESALMYEIVNIDSPPMSSVKPDIDPELDRIVLECLQKEPDERYNSAKDIAKDLKRFKRESSRQRLPRSQVGIPTMHREAKINTARQLSLLDRVPKYVWIALIGFFICTTVIAVLLFNGQEKTTKEVVRAFIPLPENYTLTNNIGGGQVALSPDGHKLAFVAEDSLGIRILWVRSLNGLSATKLHGTEGALFPFWSPDNKYIAFTANGKLKKIEATGGPPFSICDMVTSRGGSWGKDGIIIFPVDQSVGISQVSDAGGTPKEITVLDKSRNEQTHRWPYFLPDGKHFLYFARTSSVGSWNSQ